MNNILLKITVGILVFLGIAGAFLWVSYTDMSPAGTRMADARGELGRPIRRKRRLAL